MAWHSSKLSLQNLFTLVHAAVAASHAQRNIPSVAVWRQQVMVRGQVLMTQVCVCMSQAPEELFEVTAQCLMSGQDRDALSGWGAIIHVM